MTCGPLLCKQTQDMPRAAAQIFSADLEFGATKVITDQKTMHSKSQPLVITPGNGSYHFGMVFVTS